MKRDQLGGIGRFLRECPSKGFADRFSRLLSKDNEASRDPGGFRRTGLHVETSRTEGQQGQALRTNILTPICEESLVLAFFHISVGFSRVEHFLITGKKNDLPRYGLQL